MRKETLLQRRLSRGIDRVRDKRAIARWRVLSYPRLIIGNEENHPR